MALATESKFPIELNIEYADQSRFPEKAYLHRIVDLYQYKYSKQKIDLVLALGDESLSLLLEYGEQLFGDIPALLVTNNNTIEFEGSLKPNMTILTWGLNLKNTFRYIQSLLPQTRHLHVISGTSVTDRSIRDLAAITLGKLEAKWNISYMDGLAATDLLEKVSNLPEDSVICYLTVFRDGKGENFIPRDLLSEISRRANAPVFGIVDTYLGHGIVGGSLASSQNRGKRMAKVAVKLLRGEPLISQDLTDKDSSPMFDWHQLKRWSINENRLPKGSLVRYREPSIWEEHKKTIVGIMLIISIQAYALIHLLTQRRKRRLAQEESQQLRDELAHVSRVLTMGELTTSLAHEINQPLAAIQSYAQAAQRFLRGVPADLDEVDKSLHGIIIGNRRAKTVIQGIRQILNKKPQERSPLRVKELIDDVIMLVQQNAKDKTIILSLTLVPGLPQIFGNRTQLQQVVLNLIINGFEAMEKPGDGIRELVVRASQYKSDRIMVSVRDSGPSVDEEHLDRLFNAFYTTKKEGLGMGLSISRTIIEDHGGQLWATRNNDKGMTFSFTVPIYVEST